MTPPHSVACLLTRFVSAGTPWVGNFLCHGMGMDAQEFFARQQTMAREIREQLEKEHAMQAKTAPTSTAQKFRVSDPVWVLRPRPMGTHRNKTWFASEEVAPGLMRTPTVSKWAPGSSGVDMKVNTPLVSLRSGGKICPWTTLPMWPTQTNDSAEQDKYTNEKIRAQCPGASAPGGVEFKVRWRGYAPFCETWEPVSSFVPRINTPFMEYVRKHRTKLQVSDLEDLTRAIEAMSD